MLDHVVFIVPEVCFILADVSEVAARAGGEGSEPRLSN